MYSQTSSPSANHMEEAVVNIARLLAKNATAQLITRAWQTTEGCLNEQTHFELTTISKPQDDSTALSFTSKGLGEKHMVYMRLST